KRDWSSDVCSSDLRSWAARPPRAAPAAPRAVARADRAEGRGGIRAPELNAAGAATVPISVVPRGAVTSVTHITAGLHPRTDLRPRTAERDRGASARCCARLLRLRVTCCARASPPASACRLLHPRVACCARAPRRP